MLQIVRSGQVVERGSHRHNAVCEECAGAACQPGARSFPHLIHLSSHADGMQASQEARYVSRKRGQRRRGTFDGGLRHGVLCLRDRDMPPAGLWSG